MLPHRFGVRLAYILLLIVLLIPMARPASAAPTPPARPDNTVCWGSVIHVSGPITGDTWWENNIYVLDGDVTVQAGATLRIGAGVVVKADYLASIFVEGRLEAVGSVDWPVHFTSYSDDSLCGDTNGDGSYSTPGPRDWGYIQFASSADPASIIERAIFRYGGNDHYDDAAPIRLENIVPHLDYLTFTDNYRNAVELIPGNWTSQAFPSQTVLYWMSGDIHLLAGNTWTIQPGARFAAAYLASLFVHGKLAADGASGSPIVFTSEKDYLVCGTGAAGEAMCDTNNDGLGSMPSSRDWGYIQFASGADPTSSITFTAIYYSGNDHYDDGGAVRLENISPALGNLTLKGNHRNAVELIPGNWTTQQFTSKTVLYWLSGDITLLASNTWTVGSGVKFTAAYLASLFVHGKLTADGASDSPIIFTSEKDNLVCGTGAAGETICDPNNDETASTPGSRDWGYIQFAPEADPYSSLTFAAIRYSGNDHYDDGGAVRLDNISPNLANLTLTGNYRNAAELVAGNWTSHDFSSTTVLYWLPDDVTVLAGNTFTFLPGVKVVADYLAALVVRGTLQANGSQADPVLFTSVHDPLACGSGAGYQALCDADNASTYTPSAGDWGGILIMPEAAPDGALIWVDLRYAGNQDYNHGGALRVDTAPVYISHVLFEKSYGGLEVSNGAQPQLVCNDFVDLTDQAILNLQPASILSAENQWWGSASGPAHSSNPSGAGEPVSDGVDFTPWASTSCTTIQPAGPNNDFDQATPITLSPNGLDSQTLQPGIGQATVAADDPDMGCGAGINANTVWFKFTPTFTGEARFRTYSLLDPSASSTYDTVLALFSGARGSLNRLACNDNFSTANNLSELRAQVSAGQTYYLEVANKTAGDGTLSLFYGRSLSISGFVRRPDNNPLPGVTISTGARQATTNSYGHYLFTDLVAGQYTLTPSLAGFTFTPPSLQVDLAGDSPNQDFAAASSLRPWTLMFYITADNNLDPDYFAIFNQLERAAGNQNINLVALYDRLGSGDTWYYHIQPDDDLANLAAYQDGVNRWNWRSSGVNEANMADPATLTQFVGWARSDYPAQHYALILDDHGSGLGGAMQDETSASDLLSVVEINQAIQNALGSSHLDVLVMNACLMGMLEDGFQFSNLAHYYVASEALQWSYQDGYFNTVSPIQASTTPEQLARLFADSYAAEQDASGSNYTMSVADMNNLDPLVAAVNALASQLNADLSGHAPAIGQALTNVLRFDMDGNDQVDQDDDYIDLWDFARLVAGASNDAAVDAAANQVMAAVGSYVIDNRQSPGAMGQAHGVSIFFPDQSSSFYDPANYDFAVGALWGSSRPGAAPGGGPQFPSAVQWGPLLVSYINLAYPYAPDNPTPPAAQPKPTSGGGPNSSLILFLPISMK